MGYKYVNYNDFEEQEKQEKLSLKDFIALCIAAAWAIGPYFLVVILAFTIVLGLLTTLWL